MTAEQLLWHCLAGDGRGYVLFRFTDPDDAVFCPARSFHLFQGLISGQSWDREPSLSVVPLRQANNYRERAMASCLWARVTTGESARRLAEFRPQPTLTIREGKTCKRTALWALTQPLELPWAHELSRRLAHRFCAPKKFAAVEFELHPPSTVLRSARSKPLEVTVERVVEECYGAREVAGGLPQSPDPEAWRARALS